jgi:PAS domain S-box-containing protein
MTYSGILPISILLVETLISLFLLIRIWRDRSKPGGQWLFFSIACTFLWSIGYMLEIIPPDIETKVFWAKVQYIGISFTSVGIFGFGLIHTRRGQWLTRRRVILLSIIPILTILATFTNEWHGLVWSKIELQGQGGFLPLNLTHGWWFWIYAAYSYLLLAAVTIFFFQSAVSQQNIFRGQGRIMLAGLLVPWIGNAFYIFDISPIPNLDLTPIAFTVTNIAFVIGLNRFRLLDILPKAHEAVLDAMSEAIIILDREGQIVDTNAAARRIFSRQFRELFDLPVESLLPSWERLPVTKVGREVTIDLEGEKRIFRLRDYPVTDRGGLSSGRILILADITDYSKAEAQLALQLTALKATENAIVITDSNGNIEWTNPAFTSMTGYTLEEVLGKNPRFMKSGHQDREFYKNLWDTILMKRVWRSDLYNRKKDGTNYCEYMTITPLLQPGGEISHFIAVKQDITKRKQYEQELVEMNRLKTQLLANVSHDLRTPLGIIIGYADMLMGGSYGTINQEQVKVLSEIIASSNRLLVFIENLIGQAQIESGRLVLVQNVFEPEQLVKAMHEFGAALAEKKGLALEHHIDPDFPKMLVGDVYWLKQIVINLVTNSIKFTNTGSVSLNLYVISGDHWAIEVKDTGIGIDPKDQNRIFEPFQRAEHPPNEQYAGSGLGLSIISELTKLMNGKIELDSEIGKGTAFRVILPLLIMEKTKIDTTSSLPLALVIEDDPNLSQIYCGAVEAAKYEAKAFLNGEEAFFALKSLEPAIVVLDLHLPGIAGEKILNYIRSERRLDNTRVITVTADSVMAAQLDQDSDLTLLKPVTYTQLRDLAMRLNTVT